MKYLLLCAVLFAGGTVQSMTGIGYGMICMTFMTMVFPYIPVMLSLKVLNLSFSLPVILFHWKKIRWDILATPVLFSVAGSWIAKQLLFRVDERVLKIYLGFLIAAVALWGILSRSQKRMKEGPVKGAVCGVLTGFFSGSGSIAGPTVSMYYLNIQALSEDKEAYYATTIMTFQLISMYQFVTIGITEGIPPETWRFILMGILPTVAGVAVGKKLYGKIDEKAVRRLTYLVMLIAGTLMAVLNLKGTA